MMYRLNVWSRLTSEILVGDMVCEIDDYGLARGAFRYSPGFLEHVDAFPLDPVSLPLQQEIFEFRHPGVAKVFEDSLPDDWGRKLLIRKHGIPQQRQNMPVLLAALGGSALGALAFSRHKKVDPPLAYPSVINLSTLLHEAEKFERGEARDGEITMLLSAGSSPGGARPKALVCSESAGIGYIAKFPSEKDTVNVVRIEAATMSLARKAGLVVPNTVLSPCGRRDVLLVERFDIVPSGRRHMISMQTLLKADGYYVARYGQLLDIVRRFSADPARDSEALFRQMVFNAVIGNTDDHLKNFWMTYGAGEGWRLSPAFDLVPNIGQRDEHVLLFDCGPYHPGRGKLEKLGRSWGVHLPGTVIGQVYEAVSTWREEFVSHGVAAGDVDRFREIDRNLSAT
ncbi:type II toxin-antitoxin system HipA family toxin [Geobacter sp. FeAm09]|uniref:type II toxin-antitoxin system HipA family toxin n=1 Tax=Geobacter sp. FeAm09 TaxID=2597769 RepID=UPI0011F07D32|nr:type II toxin-antitoxin system HipA family toxin [Geobacter sp. FeAm09]QEM67902.1 type II toxin-antitoxin system HipA family toxin [Geobacter sp. FeAm09]